MPEFKPNHFVDGPFIELEKPKNPVLRALSENDDEDLEGITCKKSGFAQSVRVRAVGRGNYGSNNYRLMIEAVEILVSLLPAEVTNKDPKRFENIISSYVPTGKSNMSYEECSAEIDALRPIFNDPKKVDPIVKRLKLPAELKEWYLEKINPYKNISTAMVMTGSSVVFARKYDEEGNETLYLPLARITEDDKSGMNIISTFYRACGIRVEDVRLQQRKINPSLRIVFQGATATLNRADYLSTTRQGTPVTLVPKEDILTDTRIDADSKRYLLWIKKSYNPDTEQKSAGSRPLVQTARFG